jgi:hypothetical protein
MVKDREQHSLERLWVEYNMPTFRFNGRVKTNMNEPPKGTIAWDVLHGKYSKKKKKPEFNDAAATGNPKDFTKEDAHDAEGASSRVAKTKKRKKLIEGNIPKLSGFSSFKDAAEEWVHHNDVYGNDVEFEKKVKSDGKHQTISIGHSRKNHPYIIGVFNHTGEGQSEEGHGTHHSSSQGLDESKIMEANICGLGLKDLPSEHKKLSNKVKELSKTELGHTIKLTKTPNGAKILTHYRKGKIVTKTSFHSHYDDLHEDKKSEFGANKSLALSKALSTKSKATPSYFDHNDQKLSPAAKDYLNKKKTFEDSSDKYKKAAKKLVLSKKAKNNKHVDTEPVLHTQDKGGHGPIEANNREEQNAKL